MAEDVPAAASASAPEIEPTIEFFEGLPEELSDVSLRRSKQTGDRIVVMIFEKLQALDGFNSYRGEFRKALHLRDSEGIIEVEPDVLKMIYGGDEEDELRWVECKFAIPRDDHFERFMRFMNRYAAANGMAYEDKK